MVRDDGRGLIIITSLYRWFYVPWLCDTILPNTWMQHLRDDGTVPGKFLNHVWVVSTSTELQQVLSLLWNLKPKKASFTFFENYS